MDMVDWSSQSGFVGVAMMLICHVIHCRPTNECTWRYVTIIVKNIIHNVM